MDNCTVTLFPTLVYVPRIRFVVRVEVCPCFLFMWQVLEVDVDVDVAGAAVLCVYLVSMWYRQSMEDKVLIPYMHTGHIHRDPKAGSACQSWTHHEHESDQGWASCQGKKKQKREMPSYETNRKIKLIK